MGPLEILVGVIILLCLIGIGAFFYIGLYLYALQIMKDAGMTDEEIESVQQKALAESGTICPGDW